MTIISRIISYALNLKAHRSSENSESKDTNIPKTKPLFSWHYLPALLGYVYFTLRDEVEDSKVHDLRFDPNREQCQEFLEYCGLQ